MGLPHGGVVGKLDNTQQHAEVWALISQCQKKDFKFNLMERNMSVGNNNNCRK